MFNKKKREIERLNRELDERIKASDRLFQRYSFYFKQSEALKSERDAETERLRSVLAERDKLFDENAALMRVNGTLKRELDEKIFECKKAKSDLTGAEELLADFTKRFFCPGDCKGHSVAAPGGSYCRACIRNPHAKDKYESGGDTK